MFKVDDIPDQVLRDIAGAYHRRLTSTDTESQPVDERDFQRTCYLRTALEWLALWLKQQPAPGIDDVIEKIVEYGGHRENEGGSYATFQKSEARRYRAEADEVLEEVRAMLAAPAAQAAQPVSDAYKSGAQAMVSVGDSFFESWYSLYNHEGKSTKQTMREAYEAGMVDHEGWCDTAAQGMEPIATAWIIHFDGWTNPETGRHEPPSPLRPINRHMFGSKEEAEQYHRAMHSHPSREHYSVREVYVYLNKQQAAQAVADDVVRDYPEGWIFHSADFSMAASCPARYGRVTLVRDLAGRAWWLSLSDEDKERVPLYVYGSGNTLSDAIKDAALLAAASSRRRGSREPQA